MVEAGKDEREIRAIIEDGFAAIGWSPEKGPDWERFFAAYVPGAQLLPAARPAAFVDRETFRERMDGQRASGAMTHFHEDVLGASIRVFGNVAVATAAFRAVVNKDGEGRGVNTYLFARDADGWKIAGVAWDNEGPGKTIPEDLTGGGGCD